FLPLNQLVSLLPPPVAPWGIVLLPAAALLFVAALPFLDRGPRLALASRLPWMGGLGAVGAGAAGLLALGVARQPAPSRADLQTHELAARASRLAGTVGIPPGGG